MANLEQLKMRAFQNLNVKKYYDELAPEYAIIESRIRKRLKKEKVAQALDAKLKISIS